MNQNEYKNIIVASLFKTKNGSYQSMPADDRTSENLEKAFEKGGKFFVRLRSQEAMSKARVEAEEKGKPEYSVPVAYLEFIPRTEVEAYNSKKSGRSDSGL